MDLFDEYLISLGAWLMLAGPIGVVCAALWLSLPRTRRWLLPPQREHAVPWTGAVVLLVIFGEELSKLLVNSGLQLLPGAEEIDKYYRIYAVIIVANLAFIMLAPVFMYRFSDTLPYQLGLHTSRWREGILLGSLAWLISHPLIELLNYVVVWLHREWTGQAPKPHDLIKLMQDRELALEWTLLLSVALIGAPLVEEFLFRGVLLRWAGRLAWRGYLLIMVTIPIAMMVHQDNLPEILLFLLILLPGFQFCPLLLEWAFPIRAPSLRVTRDPEGTETDTAKEAGIEDSLLELTGWMFVPAQQDLRLNQPRAVYATALLFAAVHPWPTPIPLFLLGLLLGWLAYRTQSLIAPVTLHVLFNAVACIEVALTL